VLSNIHIASFCCCYDTVGDYIVLAAKRHTKQGARDQGTGQAAAADGENYQQHKSQPETKGTTKRRGPPGDDDKQREHTLVVLSWSRDVDEEKIAQRLIDKYNFRTWITQMLFGGGVARVY